MTKTNPIYSKNSFVGKGSQYKITDGESGAITCACGMHLANLLAGFLI